MIGQKNGGDGRNTTKAQKANMMAITKVIYRGWIHFLTSLNREKPCSVVGFFFNELEPCDKIYHESVGSFFNELKPCRKYAQRSVGSFF